MTTFARLGAMLLLASVGAAALADTLFVPDDYPTIQEALFGAHDGDTIVVRDGVWTGPYNRDIDFGGLAVTLRSENGPENCVIDCQGEGRGFHFRSGEGWDSVVDGFTITRADTGVYCFDGSPTIRGCTLVENGGIGAAVRCLNGTRPAIQGCAITENGGLYAIDCQGAAVTISGCVISGTEWAGVHCAGSSMLIADCLITGNGKYASGGGGLHCSDSIVVIRGSTFSGNSAADCGGAVYGYNSTFFVRNSVFWGNTADEGPEFSLSRGHLTIDYSDVEGGWAWIELRFDATLDWGEGNIVADPLFVNPDSNYHLSADSPCIDAGDPDFIPGPDERDIDGQMRVWDGNDDGQWVVDMGSDEYGSQAPGDLNGDGCVNHADLGILLAFWGSPGGDLNGDGTTDQSDLGILLTHWGEGCP